MSLWRGRDRHDGDGAFAEVARKILPIAVVLIAKEQHSIDDVPPQYHSLV